MNAVYQKFSYGSMERFYEVFETAKYTFILLQPLEFFGSDWRQPAAILNTVLPCSYFQMSPLIVQNIQEAKEIPRTFQRKLIPFLEFIKNDFFKISFGLKQTNAGAGHKFHWGQGEDLLFSYSASGEPRNNHAKRCAIW